MGSWVIDFPIYIYIYGYLGYKVHQIVNRVVNFPFRLSLLSMFYLIFLSFYIHFYYYYWFFFLFPFSIFFPLSNGVESDQLSPHTLEAP